MGEGVHLGQSLDIIAFNRGLNTFEQLYRQIITLTVYIHLYDSVHGIILVVAVGYCLAKQVASLYLLTKHQIDMPLKYFQLGRRFFARTSLCHVHIFESQTLIATSCLDICTLQEDVEQSLLAVLAHPFSADQEFGSLVVFLKEAIITCCMIQGNIIIWILS